MMTNELDTHVLVTDYHNVKQICQPLKKASITGFIFMRHFPDGKFIDLSNQLDWSLFFLSRYFNEKYDVNTVQDHMFVAKGISLWTLNPENVVWQEGENYFEFGNGISIAIEKKSYKDIFCFYARKQDYSINEFYLKNIDALKGFCYYFVDRAAPLIKKGYQNKLETPKLYLPQIDNTQHKKLFNFFHSSPSQNLSKRECECIQFSAKGLSAKAIANQLSVSKRTVETHLTNAKIKLNCSNLAELIYLCTKFSYID